MKKEFTHELIESFKYSAKGEFQQAEIIKVTAPKTTEFYDNLQFLDSLCGKAEMRSFKNIAGLLKELNPTEEQKALAKEQLEEKDENETALDVYYQTMSGLEKEEIKQLNLAICEMLKKSALVDGEKSFEQTFWDEISFEDKRLLIGKYIANFTVSAQRK